MSAATEPVSVKAELTAAPDDREFLARLLAATPKQQNMRNVRMGDRVRLTKGEDHRSDADEMPDSFEVDVISMVNNKFGLWFWAREPNPGGSSSYYEDDEWFVEILSQRGTPTSYAWADSIIAAGFTRPALVAAPAVLAAAPGVLEATVVVTTAKTRCGALADGPHGATWECSHPPHGTNTRHSWDTAPAATNDAAIEVHPVELTPVDPPIPAGLCGIRGCVYMEGHAFRGNGLSLAQRSHSWQPKPAPTAL